MKIIHSEKLEFVPASHEIPQSPGVLKKVLLKRDDFVDGHVQMLNWALLPAGKSFQSHFHEDMQEVFILIRGVARITVEDKEATMGRGDAVVIPVGAVHMMENTGKEDVEYIAVGVSKDAGGKTISVSPPRFHAHET
jgi:mannose-6-phosphate isomerase-like protein (cupin superfamily)